MNLYEDDILIIIRVTFVFDMPLQVYIHSRNLPWRSSTFCHQNCSPDDYSFVFPYSPPFLTYPSIPLNESHSQFLRRSPLKRHIFMNSRIKRRNCFSSPMESVASNSTPPQHWQAPGIQPFADRIVRALHHHLRLLHRSDDTFFVLGATDNVYTVTVSTTPSCTCPDRVSPCKHILFVFIRVLGLPLDAACLRKRSLRPCQVSRLLHLPTLPESLAIPSVCLTFQHLFFGTKNQGVTKRPNVEIAEGTACPVCLEEMAKEQRMLVCGTCRNPVHHECFSRWKRSSGRRSATCVICRARWRPERTAESEQYLNLAAYVQNDAVCGGGGGSCAG